MALVVTVIVLLILAGISISMLTGNNSIINRAGNAKEQSEIVEEKEIVGQAAIQAMGKNKYGDIKKNELENELNEIVGIGKIKVFLNNEIVSSDNSEVDISDYVFEYEDNSDIVVEFINTNHRYLVNMDGEVSDQISYDTEANTDWEKINYELRTDDDGKQYYVVTGLKSGVSKTSITTINIAKNYKGVTVKTIGEGAFNGCSKVSKINLPNSITKIETDAFKGCGMKTIVIPNSVITIGGTTGHGAFQGCSNLEEVVLGNNISSLGNSCFRDCLNLTHINIPNSLTSCDGYSFRGCTKLTKAGVGLTEGFELEREIIKIADRVFDDSNLQEIEIPNSVTTIGGGAFRGCKLTEITIPDSVTTINGSDGFGAFQNCTLLNKVTWGTGIVSIGTNAFDGCTSLNYIKIPKTVTSMGRKVFSNCTGLTKAGTGLTEGIDMESGMTSIPNEIFSYSQIKEIQIPNTITSIGNNAFRGCTELTEITIPDSVTYIGGSVGYGAFSNCTNLKKVILSSEVKSIQQYVFYNSTNLETVIYKGSSHTTEASLKSAGITSIGTNAFTGTKITKE